MRAVAKIVDEFRERRRAGRTIVRAAGVAQAVEVAAALRACGEAQWFRGQVADWPKLAPTYYRLDGQQREAAEQRIKRFSGWVQATLGLEDLAANADKQIAVAQHYGIATTFLDFTTEPSVAGFFATDGGPPRDDIDSCIICLNLDEARHLWSSMAAAGKISAPELLEIDVANLWRLEAQHGTFVWSPYDTLDGPYPLDRIVFPYTGAFEIQRSWIYPERASPLERLLNAYFQEENIREGTRYVNEHVTASKWNRIRTVGEPYVAESFIAPPRPHGSWAEDVIAEWLKLEREHWRDSLAGPDVGLRVDVRAKPRDTHKGVTEAVSAALSRTPGLRDAAPHWLVEAGGTRKGLDGALMTALQHVWDGMARLPYSDEQLATTMGTTAAFVVARAAVAGDRDKAAEHMLAHPLKVELGGLGTNVHAFAWADEASLREALRDDFAALLVADVRDRILARTGTILWTARNPRLLFDLARLTDLLRLSRSS